MSLIDKFITEIDKGLKFSTQNYQKESRQYPAQNIDKDSLNELDRSISASLMRINHAGEVSAQGLYRGQALTARLDGTREKMDEAAEEELDHLAWCNKRLEELDAKPSIFNPIWYGLSFTMGAIAGMAGDKWSLGFVHETEEQVVEHLKSHMGKIPASDSRTASILEQMAIDEAHHSEEALQSGAVELPDNVKKLMAGIAKIMTKTSYYV